MQPPEIARLQAQARNHTTSCGDGEMVWRMWGPLQSDLPPLVLFHGGSGSWTHWVRNIDDLAATGRCVWIPDLPGFGASDLPPAGADADALVAPLADGMRALFGQQACDLVGFSFGGMTAGMLLAAHPELARQLVLVGAPAMGVMPKRQFELKAWRHLPPEAQLDIHRYNLAALMLNDTTLIEGLALDLHVVNVMRDRMPRRRLSHTDILARSLSQIDVPVQAIYGQNDVLYKGWGAALESAYTAAAPDFRGFTQIPDAGHWVQFERPAAFSQSLLIALQRGAHGG